jgi:hypothetical protein
MAVGLKSRIIYREKTKEDGAADYWAGEYKLLIRAKSIPSPFGSQISRHFSDLVRIPHLLAISSTCPRHLLTACIPD